MKNKHFKMPEDDVVTLKISPSDFQIQKRLLEEDLKKLWNDGLEGPFSFPDLTIRCKNNETLQAHKLPFALVCFFLLYLVI